MDILTAFPYFGIVFLLIVNAVLVCLRTIVIDKQEKDKS